MANRITFTTIVKEVIFLMRIESMQQFAVVRGETAEELTE